MRRTRRLFVYVLVAAFALSGGVAAACVDAQAVAAAQSASAAVAHDHGAMSATSSEQGHQGDQASVDADKTQAPADHHAGFKCCNMVTSGSTLPSLSATAVVFSSGKVIAFANRQRDLFGSTPAVDPGIPKRIV